MTSMWESVWIIHEQTESGIHNQTTCSSCFKIPKGYIPAYSWLGETTYLPINEAPDSVILAAIREMIYLGMKLEVKEPPKPKSVIKQPSLIFDAPMFEEDRLMKQLGSLEVIPPAPKINSFELAGAYELGGKRTANLLKLACNRMSSAIQTSLYINGSGPCPESCFCHWVGKDQTYKITEMGTTHLISSLLFKKSDDPAFISMLNDSWFPGRVKTRAMVGELLVRFSTCLSAIEEFNYANGNKGNSQSTSPEQKEVLSELPDVFEL